MVVICKGINCPYVSPSGFCKRRVVSLLNGGCEYLQKGLRKEEPLYFDTYRKSYLEQEKEKKREELVGVFSLIAKQKEGK
ncbi:MAG: hypothetical protein VZR09_11140 [Candidatus Gastranaerophilaceae bacterium]|nr:hypothetical protein [Candidatus Gastranaerophilaceae bacterium]